MGMTEAMHCTSSLCIVIIWTFLSATRAQRFVFDAVPGRQPPPRTDACLHSFGDTAVLFGGRQGTVVLSDTWLFVSARNVWIEIATPQGHTPAPRFACVCAGLTFDTERYLYVIGGRDATHVLQTSVAWAFQISLRKWIPLTLRSGDKASNLAARAWAVGGAFQNILAIFMSHGQGSEGRRTDAVMIYFAGVTVGRVRLAHRPINMYAMLQPHALVRAASAVSPTGTLVVTGGCYFRGKCPNQDTWAFNSLAGQWQFMNYAPTPQMGGVLAKALPSFARAGMDDRTTMVLYGGEPNSAQTFSSVKDVANVVDVVDLARKSWTREQCAGDPGAKYGRVDARMVVIGSGGTTDAFRYLLFGGREAGKGDGLINVTTVLFFNSSRPVLASKYQRHYYSALNVHGGFMGLSFGFLVPMGFFFARHFRFFARRHTWFVLHYTSETLGFIAACFGTVGIALGSSSLRVDHPHAILGAVLLIAMTLQVLLAMPGLRPRPDAGTTREVWGAYHRWCGRLVVGFGYLNVLLGLQLIVVPFWVWLAFLAYTALAFLASFSVECFVCFLTLKTPTVYTEYGADVEVPERESNETFAEKFRVQYNLDWYPE